MNTSTLLAALAAFWLGGLCTLDLIETPAKFRLPSMPRGAAVELGRIVFRRFGSLELVTAAVMAALAGGGHVPCAAVGCCWVLAGLSATTALLIRPRLDAKSKLWLEHGDGETQSSQADTGRGGGGPAGLKRLHRLYVAADLAKLALLIAVIVLLVL